MVRRLGARIVVLRILLVSSPPPQYKREMKDDLSSSVDMRAFSLATALISSGFVLGSPTPGVLPNIPGVPGIPLPGVPDILSGIPAVAIPNVPLPGIPALPLSGRSDTTEVNNTSAEGVSPGRLRSPFANRSSC